MKQLLAILGLISVAAVLSGTALAESNDADKQAIAALEQGIVKGAEAKDAKAILANFADGDSLIVFDVIPPRECRGRDAYLKNWQSALDGCADHPKMEIDDLVIETAGTMAYSHSIQRFTCTDAKGNNATVTLRATDVYKKTDGKWLIVHEHYSVPVDLDTAKADLNSKP